MKDTIKTLWLLRPKQKLTLHYLLSLLIAVLLALALGGVIMLLCGYDPLSCYGALVSGALSTPVKIGNTLAKAGVLCLTALAMSIAAKAGIFNVGGEGQLYLGAMAAAVVGAQLKGTPAILAVPLCLLAAMAAGGAYAWIPGVFKVKWNVNEVVTTILLNSAAIYFCSYLANGPLKTADRAIKSGGTDAIDPAFMFPRAIKLSNLTTTIFLTAAIALIVWYVMTRTSSGFEMKLSGQNDRFAQNMGIPSGRLMLSTMVISGAICGLVGCFEVMGLHKRFITSISSEFYFDGMLVAMIMRYNPFGIVLMSLFFAVLNIGSTSMELATGISSELILIVQSIIIFFMAAEGGVSAKLREAAARRGVRRQAKREAKKEAAA